MGKNVTYKCYKKKQLIMKKILLINVTIIIIIFISAILHANNMFSYPYYESDEGTYISQAWSIVKEGKLSPYTYWYDHPPLGWIIISWWVDIFGGDFFKFGSTIDIGRVFMLFIHVFSTLTIAYIVKRLTKSNLFAIFSSVLFSISPLMIFFQRRVLLDNIMMFFILLSTAFLFAKNSKLIYYIYSGILFGLAVLVKETAVMFGIPIFLFIIFREDKVHKLFRTILWLAVSVLIVSFYILFSLLKSEFFPATGEVKHVSLIETISFQLSRGGNELHFWNLGSDFMNAFYNWLDKDFWGVIIAILIVIIALCISKSYKQIILFLNMFLFYTIFLIRGGLVLDFYIIPLFSLFAIIATLLLYYILNLYIKNYKIKNAIIIAIMILIAFFYATLENKKVYRNNETKSYKQSIKWIKQNLSTNDSLAIDVNMLVDLKDKDNKKAFYNADWFYKIDKDEAIKEKKYHSDWKNLDYIILTHEMLNRMGSGEFPITREAFLNSTPVARWEGKNAFVDLQNFESTNGDWVMILKVNNKDYQKLNMYWKEYKKRFVILEGDDYGKVVDHKKDITTSEGQSYAMLQSTWLNDAQTFEAVWLWTKNHMQYRIDDKLLSWKWKGNALIDSATATDANEDIALALLFAYKLWDREDYLAEAKEIINDIWDKSVIKIDNQYFILPMTATEARREQNYLLNPSYISPATYRIFAQIDKKHDWTKLIDDSYALLNEIGKDEKNKIYLPPDWLVVNMDNKKLSSAKQYFDRDSDVFSFDAFRIIWRVELDKQWFNSKKAKEYLDNTSNFVNSYYEQNGKLPMIFKLNGDVPTEYNSIAMDSIYLFLVNNKNEFLNKFLEKDNSYSNIYNKKLNYYDSNWLWFGFGLYKNQIKNIWEYNITKN